jgi:hypothetical protein
MKNVNKKISNALLLLSLTTATFTGAIANDAQYLKSDPIDINGYVQEEAPVTDQELETVKNELRKQQNAIKVNKAKAKKYNELSRSTEKLADTTEDMIIERKESQETIDKFNKKIDCLMAETVKEGCEKYQRNMISDEVQVSQAAPVVQTEAPKVEEAPTKSNGTIKVLPYAGLTTFMTENETLESNVSAGLRVETDVTARVSVGMGVNYTTMQTTDYANGYMANGYFGHYQSVYGGREIEYSNLNIDVYSKFYIIKNDRFRPYIGAGLGYNRASMNYTDNTQAGAYNGYNYNFGNEEVNTSYINGELLVGSEIVFTDSIGMNLGLTYNRALGSNLSSENGIDLYQAPDQQRLEDLSAELGEADIIRLNASLLVTF